MPIISKNEVIGVIVFYLEHGHQKKQSEIDFLQACSEVFSQIINTHYTELEVLKTRDNALVAEKAKSEFLANMSHEIRTPMNGVLGMTQLLQGTPLNLEQKEMLDIIETCGDSLLTILNNILDFSKIESGKMELEYITFNLKKTVEEAVFLHNVRASQKGINLLTEYQDDLPLEFVGDVTRIRQILVNFISNAIKFTEKGSVTVKIFGNEDKENKNVKLYINVIDTGIGIPKNSQKSFLMLLRKQIQA